LDGYFFLYGYSMLKAARELWVNARQQPDPGVWDRYRPAPADRELVVLSQR
jgi:hypothetical protein